MGSDGVGWVGWGRMDLGGRNSVSLFFVKKSLNMFSHSLGSLLKIWHFKMVKRNKSNGSKKQRMSVGNGFFTFFSIGRCKNRSSTPVAIMQSNSGLTGARVT
jgi:hypothetical protein